MTTKERLEKFEIDLRNLSHAVENLQRDVTKLKNPAKYKVDDVVYTCIPGWEECVVRTVFYGRGWQYEVGIPGGVLGVIITVREEGLMNEEDVRGLCGLISKDRE